MDIFNELAKPFPESAIHWRIGATNGDKTQGIALAYLDARDVMQRLDDVVGPGHWQCRYPFSGCCEIGIARQAMLAETLSAEAWIWKSNGAGETDYEGTKGQYSDAFKRAAVLWGIGRYLYDLKNEWIEIKPRGRSYVPAETPKLPTWATPAGWNRISSTIKREVYRQSVEALERGDEPGLKQVWDEFDNDEKTQLWGLFDSKQRAAMKELMK